MMRVLLAAGFAAALAATAAAQQTFEQQTWSAAAVTGTVDEAGLSMFQANSTGSVSIKSSVASGTLEIRYNLSHMPIVIRKPFDPQDDGPDQRIFLRARLRDTGAGSRVIVRLQQLNLDTSELQTLATFDSDDPANPAFPSTSYGLYTTRLNVPSTFQFDFSRFAYYVEAQLIKTSSSANPGLMAVQICTPGGACEET
jgi:hypothetical protein